MYHAYLLAKWKCPSYQEKANNLIIRKSIRFKDQAIVEKLATPQMLGLINLHYFNYRNNNAIEKPTCFLLLENKMVSEITSSNFIKAAKLFVDRGIEIIQKKEFLAFQTELFSHAQFLKFVRVGVLLDPVLRLQSLFLCRYMAMKFAA